MSNRWLQLIEMHVEKGVLGLTALFMALMLWMYLIRSPYTASYSGRELGPRELMEAVRQDAERLDNAMRSAQAPSIEPVNFSEELKKHHNLGIFADAKGAAPALPPDLRRVASFGRPIMVPGLEEAEAAETSGNIVLVSPLRTTQPKARTGRSLAVREQLRIDALGQTDSAVASEAAKSVETGWVTIAAYYDKKAQYDEMIKAGYATYRANAYVAGLEVQRQEMLSNGEFSEWQDVKPGEAMPKYELPTPMFDDQTGELINKNDVRQAYDLVKAAQTTLLQPPFFLVEAGDFWEIPPIEGYEHEEEDSAAAAVEEQAFAAASPRGGGRAPAPPARGGGRTPAGGGRAAAPTAGGRTGGAAATPTVSDSRADARKQIREDLKNARKNLGLKQYEEARRLAEMVVANTSATKGDVRQAKELIKNAARWMKIQETRAMGRGGRPGSSASEAVELVTHPETKVPALWFHDDTVEPGKTYRYRMRIKLWNRYVGLLRAMKDSEQAKQVVVTGDWSVPSEPITVRPSSYYFLSSGQEPDVASFDVWKWRKGRWHRQRFDVKPGNVIGETRKIKTGEYNEKGEEIETEVDFGTGAVLMDIRFDAPLKARWPMKDGEFNYRDVTSIIITYLDPADGQVKERSQFEDRNDPKNKELRESE